MVGCRYLSRDLCSCCCCSERWCRQAGTTESEKADGTGRARSARRNGPDGRGPVRARSARRTGPDGRCGTLGPADTARTDGTGAATLGPADGSLTSKRVVWLNMGNWRTVAAKLDEKNSCQLRNSMRIL